MLNLRQGHWPRAAFRRLAASSLTAAAALGLGLLVPGPAWATPPSHTRRPLPTALRTTEPTDGGSHAGRHGKTAARARTGTHPAGTTETGTGSGHHGKAHGKGRDRHAEPDEPMVPLYRAGRGRAPLERELAPSRHNQDRSRQASQHGMHGGAGPQHAFAHGPAPLASAYRRGSRAGTAAVTPNNGRGSAHKASPLTATAHSAPLPQPWVMRHDPRPMATTAPAPAASGGSFAEGVSHPDEDVQTAHGRPETGETGMRSGAALQAPIVRMTPAPAGTPVVPAPAASPVVQGFGSEVALPSTAPSNGADRPGGTHRRNHPSNWQPESLVTPPEPLEEREAVTEAAVSPAVLPEIYDRNGRLLMPAPLKGSHDILLHQNLMATSDGLERVYDDADLDRMRAAHQLISFPPMEALRVSEDLPSNRRVARPWTVAFTADAARAFYDHFHQPLQVNSAVRTVRYQAHLIMVNGNAAGVSGEAASPHLTGQAVDLAKRGMTQAQLAWMRGYLMPLMQAGKIDVEEEFQQACFHISVYRSYGGARHTAREFAEVHGAQGTAGTPEN